MQAMNDFGTAMGLVAVLALGACADMNYPTTTSNYSGGVYSGYGVVQSIELVRQGSAGIGGSGLGAGTIAGAVVGGILGHQVGEGQGNTAATVLGAAGGAYVGHELEKRSLQQSDAYKFTIRMNDGSIQTVIQTTDANVRVGDRVRIDNGMVQRY